MSPCAGIVIQLCQTWPPSVSCWSFSGDHQLGATVEKRVLLWVGGVLLHEKEVLGSKKENW